jgi:hypothetical protein
VPEAGYLQAFLYISHGPYGLVLPKSRPFLCCLRAFSVKELRIVQRTPFGSELLRIPANRYGQVRDKHIVRASDVLRASGLSCRMVALKHESHTVRSLKYPKRSPTWPLRGALPLLALPPEESEAKALVPLL